VKGPRTFEFIDRRTGERVAEPIYAQGFLVWAYNSWLGRVVTEFLLSRSLFSHIYGWLHRRRWSKRKIAPFVGRMKIDMTDSPRAIDDFDSFDDFFTRDIDISSRPIDPDPRVCVSPVDGRIFAYPRIDPAHQFRIKGNKFDLAGLLRDDGLARTYAHGSLVISRLYLGDYHHFHFPDSGFPGAAKLIPGRCFAVSPYSRSRSIPFYSENKRALTLFDSDHFGRLAMVEIGAFTIASIRQEFHPGEHMSKGAHKGFFGLGGSVVALLFEKDAIALDGDLCANTRAGLETFVRLGEPVGRVP
jgi:phosphatidylserine decarboxylase